MESKVAPGESCPGDLVRRSARLTNNIYALISTLGREEKNVAHQGLQGETPDQAPPPLQFTPGQKGWASANEGLSPSELSSLAYGLEPLLEPHRIGTKQTAIIP